MLLFRIGNKTILSLALVCHADAARATIKRSLFVASHLSSDQEQNETFCSLCLEYYENQLELTKERIIL